MSNENNRLQVSRWEPWGEKELAEWEEGWCEEFEAAANGFSSEAYRFELQFESD